MMSYAKKLKVYNEQSELAPDEFIEQIAKFEQLVFDMRLMQKKIKKASLPESRDLTLLTVLQIQVDDILDEMGYNPQQHIF